MCLVSTENKEKETEDIWGLEAEEQKEELLENGIEECWERKPILQWLSMCYFISS